MKKTQPTTFFGRYYESEQAFLKAMGIMDYSCSKRFRLTPTPTQEQKKAFYRQRIKSTLKVKTQ